MAAYANEFPSTAVHDERLEAAIRLLASGFTDIDYQYPGELEVKPNVRVSPPLKRTIEDVHGGAFGTVPGGSMIDHEADHDVKVPRASSVELTDLRSSDNDDDESEGYDDDSEMTGGSSSGKRQERFYCDYEGCGKSFCRGYSLKYHKYTHTNDAPYACTHPGCGKRFSHQSRLKRHMFSHNPDERLYACDFDGCGKRFSQKCHLKIHLQTHFKKSASTPAKAEDGEINVVDD